MRLHEVLPDEGVHGVAAIVKAHNRLLFLISPSSHWRLSQSVLRLPLSAPGGIVRVGEDYPSAARRCIKEDLGADAELIPARKTLVLQPGKPAENFLLEDKMPPLIVYSVPHARFETLSVSVYGAELLTRPRVPDEGGILYVTREVLGHMIHEVRLSSLLKHGTFVIEKSQLPRHSWIVPRWTPLTLARLEHSRFNPLAYLRPQP